MSSLGLVVGVHIHKCLAAAWLTMKIAIAEGNNTVYKASKPDLWPILKSKAKIIPNIALQPEFQGMNFKIHESWRHLKAMYD